MSFLNKLLGFHKNQTVLSDESKHLDSYADIIISLNKEKRIDFSLFINDKLEDIPYDTKDYALLCAKFFGASLSPQMLKDCIHILEEQIKNNDNELLIDNIVSLLRTISALISTKKTNNFINPTEVFAKYL